MHLRLAADVGTHKTKIQTSVSTALNSIRTIPLSSTSNTNMNMENEHGRRYAGTVDCFSKIVKEGGFQALYRGFPTALAGVILFKALFMGGYDTSKVRLSFNFAVAVAVAVVVAVAVFHICLSYSLYLYLYL